MSTSYSISGPSTGPITVPRDARWEVPAWSWAFWLKVASGDTGVDATGVFSTSLLGNGTTSGVDWELFNATLSLDLNSLQYGITPTADGLWRHVVAAMDSTDLRIYVDGVLSYTETPGAMVWGTGDLVLGAFGDTSVLMKGARIYTRKLSLSEVGTLHAGGEVPSGLLADWRMNEGSGHTITDSVSGLVGTATGTITWSTDVPAANPEAPIVVASSSPRRRRGISPARKAKIAANFRLPKRGR